MGCSFVMFCAPNAKNMTKVSEKSYTPKNLFQKKDFGACILLLLVDLSSVLWGPSQQLRTGCLSILMFLTPLAEVTP